MTAVSDLQGLTDLAQCAYALGLAFGREAQAATDHERKLRSFELFERCFHGFRVAVALKLRLARAVAAPAREREPAQAQDLSERERSEPAEPAERDRLAADRDRDREPASLPILLKALNGVVADAEAVPGPAPAQLPTLRELLARMAATPAADPTPTTADALAGVAVLARAPAGLAPKARSQLLQCTAPAGLPVPGPPVSGLAGPPPRRRATGPPEG
jgi:hypothetical protein